MGALLASPDAHPDDTNDLDPSALAAVAPLASCGYAETSVADQRTTTSVRLNGEVFHTEAGEVEYHFEYGPAAGTAYGSVTPTRTLDIAVPDVGVPVSETITGLAPGTTLEYRVCASSPGAEVFCGEASSTATRGERDEVDGYGTVVDDPATGLRIGLGLSVSSTYDPEYGYGNLTLFPGSGPMVLGANSDIGCFRLEGNRAAVGIYGWDDVGPIPMIVFIEDNGPTGDRIGYRQLAAPFSDCPNPTAGDFPDLVVDGEAYAPVITSGDVTFQDRP